LSGSLPAEWRPEEITVRERQDGQKAACVVRYGGIGDSLQSANILPMLQRQGYHVTYMTNPVGADLLRHDPHVDRFLVQQTDQVPNERLGEYWAWWKPGFDKWVNLCESVEGTLLALPGRANHAWPHALRHRELNRNYLEFTAAIADLPYKSEARFYPSQEERQRVAEFRAKHPGFMILYALSGSSSHKAYPWLDNVLAMILLRCPQAVIVLSGDPVCQLLEQGWENEQRVIRTSGQLGIREVLSLACSVEVVVGPETGVLNAVAFERDVRKVILLSHSSRENLTKHWLSTDTIEPVGTPCYPCHRLHYTTEFCPRDEETSTAMCQKSISPERVFAPIKRAYTAWEKREAAA